MAALYDLISGIFDSGIVKAVISNPISKQGEFKRITLSPLADGYQFAKYTQKQVFHENVKAQDAARRCFELLDGAFLQLNAFSTEKEYIVLISKKGKIGYKVKLLPEQQAPKAVTHNRQKQYILPEGKVIAPLVDMGIFTREGKVVQSMYDKYRQINRFIEIIDDAVKSRNLKSLNIIDFGCGKSYLTFILYYYLTELRGIDAHIIGLDLKKDVIEKCNAAAQKYGYKNLHFELGDINGYKCPFSVDMVITLHACDTATDFALYNAIQWGAQMIFSVPCCQHELNSQIKAESLDILTRYGIVQERFCALLTDSVRANLLEYCGYKTQLLEFVDFEHTPKNILIRGVKKGNTPKEVKEKALAQVEAAIKEFNVEPMLYKLLDLN
ncbi:MAG: SAM-dependent methyltransferase [Clostridia bacterium]|nr:SAM-dependent methyltransferase [Clostridia bacterium]